MQDKVNLYLEQVKELFYSGHAREDAYRPALQQLMSSFDDTVAVNDPKHSEHGAPDFIFLKKSNSSIVRGYAEAKDITVSLDKTERTEQMQRYAGYTNLFLTDYLEFRFFNNGEKYQTISLGTVKNGVLHLEPQNSERLMRELQDFIDLAPETIKSGKRLAQIMGAKARRIRDNVEIYLKDSSIQAVELDKIYQMMKKLLVHDMDAAKFADMYAQTLVYGLFVARYGDSTADDFSRSEARDLVPASNPFLRHFFDHIAGTGFDKRLAKIVDELCEIFSVSDVQQIVHKHLKIKSTDQDAKDPIIHFYEDFLQAYDPSERKRMGAYYTPIPVVQVIVRNIDKILKQDFGIAQGLASTETITRQVEVGQDLRVNRRHKAQTTQRIIEPRVQILDPAVGTATFLNETIKYIYNQNFRGMQQGMWPSYANENLVPRLFGFELMMAPYTVAHLKLGMTLKETGVDKLTNRLNVFLTNTLEEGIPQQPDLFSFGLAQAVSEESRLAAEVKSEKPVMVIMGNPPYSVSSNNKSKFIEKLVDDYKKDLNERNIQPLSDDYIKFIRFAEDMIARNGSGVVGMITNNSYIDGIIHRQMRKHLLQTFDKIYVLDLHGNSKKKETAPDGGKDVNVFDIQQGVSIVLMVKNGNRKDELGQVYHTDIYGTRASKFDELQSDDLIFAPVPAAAPSYYFVPKNTKIQVDYEKFVSINNIFNTFGSGIKFRKDKLLITSNYSREDAVRMVDDMSSLDASILLSKYQIKETSDWVLEEQRKNFLDANDKDFVEVQYRPFDYRWTYYPADKISKIIPRGDSRYGLMKNLIHRNNISLNTCRQQSSFDFQHVLVSDMPTDMCTVSLQTKETGYAFPLYIYHEDNTRTPNFNSAELSALFKNMPYTLEDIRGSGKSASSPDTVTPEDILDYIYAVLHSPSYRSKYKEFLKIDFPRIPPPDDAIEFWSKVELGRILRHLHLMKDTLDFKIKDSRGNIIGRPLPDIDDYSTTYTVPGDNLVERIAWQPDHEPQVQPGAERSVTGRIYINSTQYFGNVPQAAWEFYIGGYQPAQKWLKDRKGRQLSSDDLRHYQRIIKVLLETGRIMEEIG